MSAALCRCGCGKPAPLATRTDARSGLVRGEPARFIRGHAGSAIAKAHRRTAKGLPPIPESDAAEYAERLAHASQLVIGAVHDEGQAAIRAAITAALRIPPPPGIDPVTALVTVLAAQVDPDTTTSTRLGWVENHARPRSPGPITQNRGAA